MKASGIIQATGIDEKSLKPVRLLTIIIDEEKLQDLKVLGLIDQEILDIQEEIKTIIRKQNDKC